MKNTLVHFHVVSCSGCPSSHLIAIVSYPYPRTEGHIFGTTCAEIHLRSTPSCPTCRQPCEPRNLLRLHVDFFPGKQADAVNPPALTSGHSSADEMEEEPQLLVSGGMSILGVDLYSQNSEPRALSSPSNDCNGDGEGDEEELFSCEEDTFADVRRTSSLCLPSCSRASIGVSSCGSFDYTSSTSDSSDPTHLEEAVKVSYTTSPVHGLDIYLTLHLEDTYKIPLLRGEERLQQTQVRHADKWSDRRDGVLHLTVGREKSSD